jgi:hypothetical protein
VVSIVFGCLRTDVLALGLQTLAPGRTDRRSFEISTSHGNRSETVRKLNKEQARAELRTIAFSAEPLDQEDFIELCGYNKGAAASGSTVSCAIGSSPT